MKKIFISAIPIFLFFCISCKKSKLKKFDKQRGTYIGIRHYEASYTTYDFTYDSITMEPNFFEKVYTNYEVDTLYADTAMIDFMNDSISITHFYGLFKFPIDESNQYRLSYPGYSFYNMTVSGDTLFFNNDFVIDRGADRPGGASSKSVLLKDE